MQIHCESQITEVTVYARGALVRRRLVLPRELPPGEVDLRVSGVTPLCEAGSLRARLSLAGDGGGRSVVSVRSALRVPEAAPLVGPSVEEVRLIIRRIERLRQELGRLQGRRKRLLEQGLEPALKPHSPLERLERRIDDSLAVARALDGICAELDARILTVTERLREFEEQREAAALRDAQAATAARVGAGHPRREIVVRLTGGGPAAEIEALEVSYVVLQARFWPVYTLRLEGGGRRAELLLEALVAQLSGEDWTGARLGLSTADLLYDARLPKLASLRYGRAQTPPRPAYRAPPEGLDRMFAGHDRVFGRDAPPAAGAAYLGMPGSPGRAEPVLKDEDVEFDGEDTGQYALDGASFGEAPADDTFDEEPTRTGSHKSAPAKPMANAPPPPPRMAPAPASMAPSPSMPPPQAMPLMMAPPAAKKRGGVGAARSAAFEGGFGGGPPPAGGPPGYAPMDVMESLGGMEDRRMAEPAPSGPPEPDGAWLDFDALRLGGPADPRRGRLHPGGPDGAQALAQRQAAQLEAVVPPVPGAADPRLSRGRFDHRYEAAGRCDVPSDGLCHRVALGSAAAGASLRFRTVPREAQEVYREVELKNPLAAPLLAGPVDVYVEGSLLLQTVIEPIDRGGTFTVGMGVEERLRVARNARSEEESAGLMGGSTVVTHTVSIEIASALGREALVEIVDRLPVSDDKSVEIRRVYGKPEGEPYKQADRGQPVRGGWLWRVAVPPGKKAQVEFQYRVLLPAKSEIVGGNRRE